jgi:hypothetical protein
LTRALPLAVMDARGTAAIAPIVTAVPAAIAVIEPPERTAAAMCG